MAIAPWFVSGPATLLAAIGHCRGADPTVPTPAEDWRAAVVDAVIPVSRDQHTIIHCLASLLRQTLPPRRVLLVDDGGIRRDHAIQLAREFARANGVELEMVVRTWSIGRAATIKRQAREFDGDVLFVLDADTVLASPDYIERCVRELYQGIGIASACGTVEPLRVAQRRLLAAAPEFRRWLDDDDYRDPLAPPDHLHHLWRQAGDEYRAHVARVQQGFIDRGLMCRYGGVDAPSGEAIAYRRRYLKDLFDRYEPVRGDDLTASEDLFIARAFAMEGYRSIRLADVVAGVQYPRWHYLPLQAWRWTVASLQNDLYFNPLLRTPYTAARHRWREWLRRRHRRSPYPHDRTADLRRIHEAYRQPFGERLTHRQGRPIGTGLLLLALERVGYPIAVLALALGGWWVALALVAGVEITATLAISAWLGGPGRRGAEALRALLATPPRYALMLLEPFAALWFLGGLWLVGRYRWYVRRASEPGRGGAWRRRRQ